MDREKYNGQRGIVMHDLGDTKQLSEKYSIELGRLKYSETLEVLTLKVIENESGETISYTWGAADASRIGINLRWLQAGLTLKN